jgi:hypothetical protein
VRKSFLALALLAPLAMLAAPVRAENRPPRAAPPEITREAKETIDRGLAYLAQRQESGVASRGSWDAGPYRVPVTALCGLAFLASGSTPTSGRYAENVRRAIDYLLRPTLRAPSGLIRILADAEGRPMYGHGFATLFLAECYGMGVEPAKEKQVRDALERAVQVIADAQTRDGGWYYSPRSPHEAEQDEGSVTITQIQALRAARNAGIRVPKAVIDRAVDYIRRSQDPDGGVRYTVRYGKSSLALTSAGLAVLFGAGDYDSDNVKRALAYVRNHLETGTEGLQHFHYTHFYAAQALFQQGGADWDLYFPRIRAELLRQASDDRATYCYWTSSYGEFYATALALLVLEIPYRYLPIYER